MQNSINQSNNYSESVLPFQTIEEGFDDWVRWLRSIIQNRENSSITRPVERKLDLTKESIGEQLYSCLQWDEGVRWRDDGGESAEA